MYADDIQFFDSDTPENSDFLITRIESTLATALKWFTQNRLKINPSKTEMVIFQSRRSPSIPNFSISFGTETIFPSRNVKVLGVFLDCHLSWHDHVSFVVRKCYSILIGLARTRRRIPKRTRKVLIEALVLPHIRYCLSVWGGCVAGERHRVQKAINFGARIVTGIGRRDHVTPALTELGWQTVENMIKSSDAYVLRRLFDSPHAPELLRSRVVPRAAVSVRQSRATAAGQLQLPRVRTEHARRSFLCRAIRSWNENLRKTSP